MHVEQTPYRIKRRRRILAEVMIVALVAVSGLTVAATFRPPLPRVTMPPARPQVKPVQAKARSLPSRLKVDAKALGVPLYPNARVTLCTPLTSREHRGRDVLNVLATTPDPPARVLQFYRDRLGRAAKVRRHGSAYKGYATTVSAVHGAKKIRVTVTRGRDRGGPSTVITITSQALH